MIETIDSIGPLMANLLACAEEFLTVPVGRAFLAPGAQVAWDDCCDGQLWVRLVSMTPGGQTITRGAADAAQRCGVVVWVVSLAVGVVRCAATIDEHGEPPEPEDLTADAFDMTRDLSDLEAAIICCMRTAPGIESLRITGWTPLGPMGGCIGGEWAFNVLQLPCGCEEVV